MSSAPTDFSLNNTRTWRYGEVQQQTVNSAVFGGLVCWGLWMTVSSVHLWWTKRDKPLFIMNALQTFFNLIKITVAMSYTVFFGLDCEPRAGLINVPQVVCFVLIYCIMMVKLLIFTPYKLFVKIFFGAALVAWVVIVMVGVGQSEITSSNGKCGNRYPLVYKQQYTVEMIIEAFTFLMLVYSLASTKHSIMAGTAEIFRQLRSNENLRIFLVTIFISAKIVLTYNPITAFDALSLTHAIDSARSALVNWALSRENRSMVKTSERNRKASLTPSFASVNNNSRKGSGANPLFVHLNKRRESTTLGSNPGSLASNTPLNVIRKGSGGNPAMPMGSEDVICIDSKRKGSGGQTITSSDEVLNSRKGSDGSADVINMDPKPAAVKFDVDD